MAETNTTVEIFYLDSPSATGGAWHDITSDARTRDSIALDGGRPDAYQRIPPSRLALTLDNREGTYSPRNPNSSLYSLIGRNTPIRVSAPSVTDTFTRSVSGSWGTSDVGPAWASTGSQFSVNGSAGLMSHSAAGGISQSLSIQVADVDIYVDIDPATPAGTGNAEYSIRTRVNGTTYIEFLAFGVPSSAPTIAVREIVSGSQVQLDGFTSISGVSAGDAFRLHVQVIGGTARMRAWAIGATEPTTWARTITSFNAANTGPGTITLRSSIPAGWTNTPPIVTSWDNFTLRSYRFYGEVESWPVRWDVSGNDAWAPITANGILRRLNAPGTTKPAWSPLRRAIIATDPLAYWPLEESSEATVLASALSTGQPMVLGTLPPLLGNTTLAPGAVAGVDVGNEGSATGTLTGGSNGSWSVSFIANFLRRDSDLINVVTIEAGGIKAQALMGLSAVSGTLTGPSNAVSLTGAQIAATNPGNRRSHQVIFAATQSGSDATVTLTIDGVQTDTDTLTSVTVVPPTNITINGDPVLTADTLADGTQLVIGHIAVYDSVFSTDLSDSIAAWADESAADRLDRLATEEGITLGFIGDTADTELLGVQRAAPVLDLMFEAAEADGGILYEPKENLGLTYRTKKSLYNQTAGATADYSDGDEVAPPLEPVEDTDVTANDVTVTRYQGGFANVVQETGPLNVQEPADDVNGVGRYKKDVTLVLSDNGQCIQAAAWIRHLGTWDEARYPVVNFDLTAMDQASKTSLIGSVTNLKIGDRFSITNPPSWLPPDSIELMVQGFREIIGSHHWTIEIHATPALPYDVLELETSTSDNLSRIPASLTGTTLNEALDTTETGVDIISVTARWIDSATYSAQFPFDIIVGGERMRVTALTGTGLTQTMTVTRSINGVVKSHASGTAVQLFRPPVIAR